VPDLSTGSALESAAISNLAGRVAAWRSYAIASSIATSRTASWVIGSSTRIGASSRGPAPDAESGCGKEVGACAVLWLPESSSGTHNEFRVSACPLSGDQGARAPLLIYTRGGSKLERPAIDWSASRRSFAPAVSELQERISPGGLESTQPRAPSLSRS
jgi:hypothetical protein